MSTLIIMLSLIGQVISWYTVKLERWTLRNAEHKPFCDINDYVSCSKVILSPYGKTFGISNGYFGVLYYALLIVLEALGYRVAAFGLALLGMAASLYFAYIQYGVLKMICVLCTSIYILNIVIAIITYRRL